MTNEFPDAIMAAIRESCKPNPYGKLAKHELEEILWKLANRQFVRNWTYDYNWLAYVHKKGFKITDKQLAIYVRDHTCHFCGKLTPVNRFWYGFYGQQGLPSMRVCDSCYKKIEQVVNLLDF